jgi:hypothetical protein
MKKLSYLIVAGVLAVFATSCNKSDEPASTAAAAETNETIVADANATDHVATEVDAISDESLSVYSAGTLKSAVATDSLSYLITGKYSITKDSTTTIKRLVINFGPTGVTCKDGKVRSGKIIITTKNFADIKLARRVIFENYKVDSLLIGGSITKTFKTDSSSYIRTCTIKDSITVTFPTRGTATHISDLYRVYHYGLIDTTRVKWTATWGNTNFTSAKGNTVTRVVDKATPLIYRMACGHIVKGIEVITRNNKTITVNYGNGLCDNVATATDGTKTWTIKL